MSTYRAVMLTRQGGPEVLEPVDLPLRAPEPGEARVRVLACGVGGTDIIMRRGYYPFAPKIPFVQGYDVVGVVDAIGPDVTNVKVGDKVAALTVWGGHAEMLYRGAGELVPVPPGVDDAEVVALILNYATAYQMIYRVAKQKPGDTALITGANGGCGQALLELLRLENVTTYGAAAQRSHDRIKALGGIPIEGRTQPIDDALHQVLPEGVDVAYDTLGGKYTRQCICATKRGGHVIGYGFSGAVDKDGRPSTAQALRGFFSLYVRSPLGGRKSTQYGITKLYRKNRQPFLEDLPKLLDLLAARKIHPRIAARLPLLAVRQANEMLEAGNVDGKIVLLHDVAEPAVASG